MKLYRPANGTEGMWFIDQFCLQCVKMPKDVDAELQCQIQLKVMVCNLDDKEYPKQWRYDEKGNPVCTSFKSREKHNAARRKRLIATDGPDLFN
jgi:hypothetical protein